MADVLVHQPHVLISTIKRKKSIDYKQQIYKETHFRYAYTIHNNDDLVEKGGKWTSVKKLGIKPKIILHFFLTPSTLNHPYFLFHHLHKQQVPNRLFWDEILIFFLQIFCISNVLLPFNKHKKANEVKFIFIFFFVKNTMKNWKTKVFHYVFKYINTTSPIQDIFLFLLLTYFLILHTFTLFVYNKERMMSSVWFQLCSFEKNNEC